MMNGLQSFFWKIPFSPLTIRAFLRIINYIIDYVNIMRGRNGRNDIRCGEAGESIPELGFMGAAESSAGTGNPGGDAGTDPSGGKRAGIAEKYLGDNDPHRFQRLHGRPSRHGKH